MDPRHLSIEDFTYLLPQEKIARFPLEERDQSKLLVYKSGKISEANYAGIAQHIPPGTLMVFNNTKVVEARLIFYKPTGAFVEVFCLEPDERYADISTAMQQKGKVWYKCLVGRAGKWKHGMVLEKKLKVEGRTIVLQAAFAEKLADVYVIELSWQPADLTFAEILHLAGQVPLPPYLHRQPEETDKERYQTIYARHKGSVAAPTAGLHFTQHVFEQLRQKDISTAYVTLHVGAGTFKPVKAATMEAHDMHAEFIDVNRSTIEQLMVNVEGTIVAVGTTSLRTIESLYWLGVKVQEGKLIEHGELTLHQWEAYELPASLPAKDALAALAAWMDRNNMNRVITKTQILIGPGYDLKIAKGLVTNFHQPNSTLLLLVAAITGNDWKMIYNHALENNYRFLSYGDGCLLWR